MFVIIIFVALTHISVVAKIFDIDILNLDILAIRDRYYLKPKENGPQKQICKDENVTFVPHLRTFPCPSLVEYKKEKLNGQLRKFFLAQATFSELH